MDGLFERYTTLGVLDGRRTFLVHKNWEKKKKVSWERNEWNEGKNPNSQPMRNKKNRENTRQRKTITRTRQYLRGSAICLRPRSCRDITIIREEYSVQPSVTIFSLCIKHDNNTTLKNLNNKRRFHNGLSAQAFAPWTKP